LYDSDSGLTRTIDISISIKQVALDPSRTRFFGVNVAGGVTLFNFTFLQRPFFTLQGVRAIRGVWRNSHIIVICQDSKARIIDVEAEKVVNEARLTGHPVSMYIGSNRIVYGLEHGRCEVWQITEPLAWKRLYVTDVGDLRAPIIHVGWVQSS
jgi:hypothetical protein